MCVLAVTAGMARDAVLQCCDHCCRWDIGQASEEEGKADKDKGPARGTVRRLAGLISGDRGLILLATLFGVGGPWRPPLPPPPGGQQRPSRTFICPESTVIRNTFRKP